MILGILIGVAGTAVFFVICNWLVNICLAKYREMESAQFHKDMKEFWQESLYIQERQASALEAIIRS